MIDEALFDAEEKMEKAVGVARDDLASIRTGRANPGMFSRVNIDYYGSMTPITQLASINVPGGADGRDQALRGRHQLRHIEDAIRNSDLGVNPTNDGNIIRVAIPQLTEERRRELGQAGRGKGEDAKVAVRNVRRKADGGAGPHQEGRRGGEDEVARAEKELDKSTHGYTAADRRPGQAQGSELLEV
jgi:ribosome recycling factor